MDNPGPQMVGASQNPHCIWPGGGERTRILLLSLQGRVFSFWFLLFHMCWSHLCFFPPQLQAVPCSLSKAIMSPVSLGCLCLALGSSWVCRHWAGGQLRCCCEFGKFKLLLNLESVPWCHPSRAKPPVGWAVSLPQLGLMWEFMDGVAAALRHCTAPHTPSPTALGKNQKQSLSQLRVWKNSLSSQAFVAFLNSAPCCGTPGWWNLPWEHPVRSGLQPLDHLGSKRAVYI